MKTPLVGFAILFVTLTLPAHAGTAMTVKNEALGFSLSEFPQGDVDASICDNNGQCLSFNDVKDLGDNTVLMREVSGKCELTVQTFDKSFRSGNTKNEFMLDLMAFVVKAVKGEENCKLQQTLPMQPRSVTGIYL